MSANLKISINDIVTNIPITAITPAFNPNKLIKIVNAPSGVSGISNSVTETFVGSANLEILPDALIANKINKIIDIPFAYFFNLGNFFLIPLAKIDPCNNPIPKTILNVIRKFSSAICKISKLIIISNKQSFLNAKLTNFKQIEKLLD